MAKSPLNLLKIAGFHWFFEKDFNKFAGFGVSSPEPKQMHISKFSAIFDEKFDRILTKILEN